MFTEKEIGAPVQPCPLKDPAVPKHWIEIEMVGEDGKPVAWAAYRIRLANGDVARGYLDDRGYARVENILPGGQCQVTFPELDGEAWEFIESTGRRPAAPVS